MFKKFILSLLLAFALSSSVSAAPALFRPDDIPTGLEAYWKLDEASGTRADSSGNGRTLTDNNTVTSTASDYWKTGENSALFTKANTEYLSLANASAGGIVTGGSKTIAFWYKRLDASYSHVIMGTQTGAGGGFYIQSWLYSHRDITVFTDWTDKLRSNADILPDYIWTHITVVIDSTNNTVAIYKNGNLDKISTGVADMTASTQDFKLGGDAAYYSNSNMKDVAIWSTVLTPIQIKSLALGVDLSTLAYRPSDVSVAPTHWWKLNELSDGSGAVTRLDSALTGGINLTDNNTVKSAGGYIEGVGASFADAANENLSAVDSPDWDFGTGDFSFSLWLRLTATPGGTTKYIIARKSGGDVAFCIYYDGANLLTRINNANVNIPAVSLGVGTNYHIAWKRTSGQNSLWLDGVKLGSDVTNAGSISEPTIFNIGAYEGGIQGIPAVISDVAVWKGYAITDDEIDSLACAIPLQQTGIVSYHKLDEASGTRVDSIGSNDLTDNNTVLSATGKVDDGADFEASNSEYLSIADNAELSIVSDFTLLAWVKLETVSANQHIIDKRNSAGTSGYFLRVSSANKIEFATDAASQSEATSLTSATWAHVVGLFDGANKTVYKDSFQDGTGATTDEPSDNAESFVLGRRNALTDSYLDGILDEVLVAKRWFRPEEIKSVYIKGLNGQEATYEPNPAEATSAFKVKVIVV